MFSYGKMLKVDYKDKNSQAYIVQVETSKGRRDLLLFKNMLVIDSCQLVQLWHVLKENENIIIALQPFIASHVPFADSNEETSMIRMWRQINLNLIYGHHKKKMTKK